MIRTIRIDRTFVPLAAALALLCALPGAAQETAEPAAPPDHEEIVRRFTAEVYNEQQLDAIPRYVADSFVDHSPGGPPGPHGPDFVRSQAEQTFAGMPDTHFEILHLFSEGDMVAMHWRVRGTASSAFGGGGAEGRKIDVEGISLFRMEDGKIAESWDIVDRLTLFQQAGFRITPPSAFRSAPDEGVEEEEAPREENGEPRTPRPEESRSAEDGEAAGGGGEAGEGPGEARDQTSSRGASSG